MSLLVVGSVAYDTVTTPFGTVDDALGGAATYFSAAASYFVSPVKRRMAPEKGNCIWTSAKTCQTCSSNSK